MSARAPGTATFFFSFSFFLAFGHASSTHDFSSSTLFISATGEMQQFGFG